MAEPVGGRVGFDASAANKALDALAKSFAEYGNQLDRTDKQTKNFEQGQANLDNVLERSAAKAESTGRRTKKVRQDTNKVLLDTARLATASAKPLDLFERHIRTAFAAVETGGKRSIPVITEMTRKLRQLTALQGRVTTFRSGQPAATSASIPSLIGEGVRGPLAQKLDERRLAIAREIANVERVSARAGSRAIRERLEATNRLRGIERGFSEERRQNQESALRAAFGRGGSGGGPTGTVATNARGDADKFKNAVNEMGVSWKGLLKIFATQLVFNALGALTSQLREGISTAIEYEQRLAAIQTISPEFRIRGLEETSRVVRNISEEFGFDIIDTANGLYEALSNQVGNAADATLFLAEAARFGRASLTDLADSGNLLAGVLNSYNLTAASTANISDQLFVLIDRGRVTGDQLANTYGRLLPLAASLGIQFAEVNTALAELTIQGVTSDDALTQLTNVMLKLVKPTEALQKVFDEMGIASAEAGIAIFGFDGFLRELTNRAGTTTTEIGELFNQIRGTRGVIGLISRDSREYAETLNAIRDASRGAGAAVAASNTVLETPAAQLTRELQKVRNFFVEDFGRTAIRAILSVTDAFGGLVPVVRNATFAVGALAAVFISGGLIVLLNQAYNAVLALGVAFKSMAASAGLSTAAVGRLQLALSGIAVGVAAFAVIRYFYDLGDAVDNAADRVDAFNRTSRLRAEEQIRALRPQVEAQKKAASEIIASETRRFQQQTLLDRQYHDRARQLFEQGTDGLKTQLERQKSLISRALQEFTSLQEDAAGNIRNRQNSQRDFEFGINQERFERQIDDLNPQRAGQLLAQRIRQLTDSARKAVSSGDDDFGLRLFDEAAALANRLASDSRTRASGEAELNKVLRERQIITEQLITQERQQADEAKRTEQANRQKLLNLQTQIQRFEDLREAGIGGSEGEARARFDELNKLAKAIDQNIGSLAVQGSTPGLQVLQNIFSELRQGFVDPFSGASGNFQQTAARTMLPVLSEMQRLADTTPIDVKLRFEAFTGEKFDPFSQTGNAGQNALAAQGKELQTALENAVNLPNLTSQLDQARNEIEQFFKATSELGEQVTGVSLSDPNIRRNRLTGRDQIPGRPGSSEQLDRLRSFQTELNNLQTQALRAADQAAVTGDATALQAVITRLEGLQAAATAAGAQGGVLATVVGDAGTAQALEISFSRLSASVSALANAGAQLRNAQGQQSAIQSLLGTLEGGDSAAILYESAVRRIADQNNTVKSVSTELQGVATGLQNTQAAADRLDLSAAAAELAKLRGFGSTPVGQQRGGRMSFFANGGMPRGTDRIPTMLSAGELVMNARSSRQFYSQYMSMNTAGRTFFRENGGTVNNSTVGDVTINVGGDAAKSVNARQLANEFRREIRRRTVR